ncbi:MAG: phage BR0599 family protein [Pseudomonadota bacterium]
MLQFRGSFGELTRANGAFTAELRGLSEALNTPTGRVYQQNCAAILGDAACRFDLTTPGYATEATIASVEDMRVFQFADVAGFEPRWFERGRLDVLDGAGQGLTGAIKIDRFDGTARRVELWDRLRVAVAPGDRVRLSAGCDKRMATCRQKFNNLLNFRGFPDIPGGDWQMAHPSRNSVRSGGSRR